MKFLFFLLFFSFFGAGIKPKTLNMLGKYSTTELHPSPQIACFKQSQLSCEVIFLYFFIQYWDLSSGLLGRCCTTRATPPALFALVIF
jgi:hypothetical protein